MYMKLRYTKNIQSIKDFIFMRVTLDSMITDKFVALNLKLKFIKVDNTYNKADYLQFKFPNRSPITISRIPLHKTIITVLE